MGTLKPKLLGEFGAWEPEESIIKLC